MLIRSQLFPLYKQGVKFVSPYILFWISPNARHFSINKFGIEM